MEALAGEIAVTEEVEPDVVRREDGSWLIDGGVTVQRFKEVLDVHGSMPNEEEETYHTLAGFVISQLGRIPHAGDTFDWDGLHFEVVDMDRKRVDKVIVSRAAEHPAIPTA
jgi:putative hemolysin